MTDETSKYQKKLDVLRVEHRDLDQVIDRLISDNGVDDLQLQRMKKRKLHLKDQIAMLESKLIAKVDSGT